jgi:hypothetical protein
MQVQVKEILTSAFVLDDDWSEGDFAEGLHLALRCRHDQIVYDREYQDMWCPDCENKQLSEVDRLEYLRSEWEGAQE